MTTETPSETISKKAPLLSPLILLFMLAMNMILFVLGFLIIGKEFGSLTVYCSLFLSGAIALLSKFYPLSGPIVDDLLLNLVMGTLIQGIGMALVFYEDASTGGTDVVAKIINKFFGLPMGKGLLLVDSLICLLAMKVFGLLLFFIMFKKIYGEIVNS